MMSLSVSNPGHQPVGAVESASGYMALLQEDDVTLRSHALTKLLGCVDRLWHQVAESLPDLEAMAEDTDNPLQVQQTAAAVASRVFFHLEEPTQALRLALEAGTQHFDPMDDQSPYVQRLVSAALDAYIQTRQAQDDEEVDQAKESLVDLGLDMNQLQAMVHRLLEASCAAGKYDHALGIALEARETSQVQEILRAGGNSTSLLQYSIQAAANTVTSKSFRVEVLQVVVGALTVQFEEQNQTKVSYDLLLVHQHLNQALPVSRIMSKLLQGTEDEFLLALQLCFDLMDSGDQAFAQAVAEGIDQDGIGEANQGRSDKVQRVLVGGFSAELSLSFLHKQSKADRMIMERLKTALEERSSGSRNSLLHTAAVVTHSYLYAGTTNDSFLRDYLDWMKKASNWAKFSATSSLGVVHASHGAEAMRLLEPYLPMEPSENTSVPSEGGFAEGGSLYALGLIHGSHAGSSASKRQETTEFLRTHLRTSHANEAQSHGAALGVGLTAMGTADLAVVNELKELLVTDSAVAGEAAGIAIGMVLVGTGAGNTNNSLQSHQEELGEIVAELKNYARETTHEKIIRGVAMGLALMSFGQEENADALIEEMRSDRDPVMRYGAQYAVALAYCGTGSNKAIRILLHAAVSDVSDDVRSAAVVGLAFVLFKTPERVPQLVSLLIESFNPHVRYASCMAVGIAMAGTGDADSVAMLEPMLDDMTDYVRQGALMGTAMIYMQQSDTCNGRKIRSFREKIYAIPSEKHHSILTKMGAILSQGIIDAGGRNCSLILGSRNGFTKMSSAVGLALWLQHWHWYPMLHMFSLALTPTVTIGLNKDFKFPKKFEIQCNSKPSAFAYPRKLEDKKEEKKKLVETVTLSTTAKEKARLARKRAKAGEVVVGEMDVDKGDESKSDEEGEKKENADSMEVDNEDEPEKKPKKKRVPEPTSFRVTNPSRITKAQSQACSFDLDQRYRPIRSEEKPMGVVMLTDSTPDEDEELGAVKSPSLEPDGELAPPEPFVWTPPAQPEKTEDDKKEE
jgi:26S proteasome regulatory subunit N2